MEEVYIPAFPLGVPEGDLKGVVNDVFPKAGVDMVRAIEPPFASKEKSSPESAPSEEVILRRFITHAARSRVSLASNVVTVLPYRKGMATFLATVQTLITELPFLFGDTVPQQSANDSGPRKKVRGILLIENGDDANAFMAAVQSLGVLDGDLHKGARLHTMENDTFFVIAWSPTIPNVELGRLLWKFLHKEADHLLEGDRHSMTPGKPFSAFEMPTSVRRTDARKEPSDPPTTVVVPEDPPASSSSSFRRVGQILARIVEPKRRP